MRESKKGCNFARNFTIMAVPTSYDSTYNDAIRELSQRDVVILQKQHRFPIYREDFTVARPMIALCLQGEARVRFDHTEATLQANEVAVLGEGHSLHALESSHDLNVTLILLSKELAEEARLHAIRQDFQKYHDAPLAPVTGEQMLQLLAITRVLNYLASPDLELQNRRAALVGQLNVFFELLTTYRKDFDHTFSASRATHVFNQFMDLLAANYAKEHEVQFYAMQLNLTPKYFSKIINDATGRGANSWINEYIIKKAKKMLHSRADLTLQKIGLLLGFEEQASFTRFFHKQTGMSPREFRIKSDKLLLE